MAIIVSNRDIVAYVFMSESFKKLDKLAWLKKGMPLPQSHTLAFNSVTQNVLSAKSVCGDTTLTNWFSCQRNLRLDEEIIGLGRYGYTLTVLSSDELARDPEDEAGQEEAELLDSWAIKFARGR